MKKNKRILLILLAVAAVLTVLYFAVVRPIVNRETENELEPVALLEGEGYYKINAESNQIPVVFPSVTRSDLYEIRILNKEQTYGFTHVLRDGEDFFLMWTEGSEDSDGDGKLDREYYSPEISRMEEDFDYSTLYDAQTKIPSMIIGAGNINFKNRVYIRERDAADPTDDEEYRSALKRYGLSEEDHPVSYEITPLYKRDSKGNPVNWTDKRGNVIYSDEEGNYYISDGNAENPRYWDAPTLIASEYDYENTPTADVTGKTLSTQPLNAEKEDVIRVFVGEMLPDESGYYLRLDGRDVVYSTGTTTIGKIVYQTLEYYIQPRLVQAEPTQKSEALYTTSFRVFDGTGEKEGAVASTDTVLFTSSYALRNAISADTAGALALGSSDALPAGIVAGIVGKSVGDVIPLLYGTIAEPFRTIAPSRQTEYKIYSVAAVIRDGEYLTGDAVVLAGDTVICTYAADKETAIGMIDLATAPETLANAIVGLSVGTSSGEALSSATVDFSAAPTYEKAVYQVESIKAHATDKAMTKGVTAWNSAKKLELQTADLPSSGSLGYAKITYSVKQNGVLAVYDAIICLDGGNDTLAQDQMAAAIRRADASSGKLILGYRDGIKTTVELPVDPFAAFLVYRDFRIEGIYGTEEVIGVTAVNESERNIFYGGSAYEIKSPASRTVYSVNNDNLMEVLQSVFAEAKGSLTVDVGLTKENFEKYGLGAHTVYFEMPIGIAGRDGTTMDVGMLDRVGYHLYFSERQEGDFYYVASDLYGIVVRAAISDCDFSFVDWEFGTMWADDQMLLLNLSNIQDVTFEINYSDLKETHGFALSVNPSYHPENSPDDVVSKIFVCYVPGSAPIYRNAVAGNDEVETDNRYYASRVGGYYRTDVGYQLIQRDENFWDVRIVTNEGKIGIDQLYRDKRGGAELKVSGIYLEGVANFNRLITLTYTSKYSGTVALEDLSESEKARIGDLLEKNDAGRFVLSDDDPSAKERAGFTFSLTLVDGRKFRLTFYPYSDARYLLSFEDESAGVVSREFYLYASEIKNIVTAVRTVVAGGAVTYDGLSYLPEPASD